MPQMPKTLEEKVDALIRGMTKALELIAQKPEPIFYRTSSTNFFSPKSGQLQFSLNGPRWSEPEQKDGRKICYVERDGSVFIEGAPPDPTSEGKLDWKNRKIVFALSDKDVAAIIYGLESGRTTPGAVLVNLTHKSGINEEIVKYFKITVGGKADRDGNPTYFLDLSDAFTKSRVSVPVSCIDVTRLRLALSQSVGWMLGWDRR